MPPPEKSPDMRLLFAAAGCGMIVLFPGCRASVSDRCSDDDMLSARTVVYDARGNPAYAGQALMISSCAGGGSFCHADSALSRYGAPFGLDFDPTLADDARFGGDDASGAAHLYAAQLRIHHLRDDIYATVVERSMPPGQAGIDASAAPYLQNDGTPLPDVTSHEGRQTLRAWLACGVPVVQATTAPAQVACASDVDCPAPGACDTSVGACFLVGAIEARHTVAATPTWSSLYPAIIVPTCAIAACHGTAGAALSGGLDLSTQEGARLALVGVPAGLTGCGTRVIPGNPDASFLIAKLEGTEDPLACGGIMPSGSMLSPTEIGLFRTWIANGANAD